MKKLRITVDGKAYDVTVQVLEDDEAVVSGAGFSSPLPPVPAFRKAAPPVAPTPAVAPPPPAAPPGTVVRGERDTLLAPISGTVQKVFVEAGARVDDEAPVVLLDAMKMDTYIYAPCALTVLEIAIAAGDTVGVGDVLIRYSTGD